MFAGLTSPGKTERIKAKGTSHRKQPGKGNLCFFFIVINVVVATNGLLLVANELHVIVPWKVSPRMITTRQSMIKLRRSMMNMSRMRMMIGEMSH